MFFSFLIEAGLMGVIASIIGIIVGCAIIAPELLKLVAGMFVEIPLVVNPSHIVLGLGAGVFTSLVSAFYPGMKAAKSTVINVIKEE